MGFLGDAASAVGGFLGSNAGNIAKGAGSIIGGAMRGGSAPSAYMKGGGASAYQNHMARQSQQSSPEQVNWIQQAMMGRFGGQSTVSPTSHLMSLGRRFGNYG